MISNFFLFFNFSLDGLLFLWHKVNMHESFCILDFLIPVISKEIFALVLRHKVNLRLPVVQTIDVDGRELAK